MTTLSRDGYQWTAGAGLTKGVPTIGLIEPSSNTTGQDEIYDLIVVGAGYAALTAARDATTSGMSCFHAHHSLLYTIPKFQLTLSFQA